MPLTRVLEPEVMDSETEALDYDAMAHGAVNTRFCEDLLALGPELDPTLDVGTGTALIPIELCRQAPTARVIAVDLADSMLAVAARNTARAGLSGSITLERVDAKALHHSSDTFRCVTSNSILHHLPDPRPALGEMLRVLRPGGLLFVRDLFRPEDDEAVRTLVARHATTDTPAQRALFEASLRAAFTLEEIRAIGAVHGIPASAIQQTSDRHWTLAHRRTGGRS